MSKPSPIRRIEPLPAAQPSELQTELALPTPLTSLFGREAEIAAIMAMLDDDEIRLITLTGPGGVGKTRLALAVAHEMEGDFADGARFISLARYQRPDQVPVAVAQSLGTGVHGMMTLVDDIASALFPRQLLLVLDNFEHLLTIPPVWLTGLIASCPRLKVLVTSQTPLRLTGEHQYRVNPLDPPDATDDHATTNAAVAIFAQRAKAARADFQVTDANIEAISTLCRRLDGLPLAIELAAARSTLFTPEQMLNRLADRFHLLAGGANDAPRRLQSMRDTISWSHDLLSADERRLFRTLSVFVGSFTLEAAESVAGNGDDDVVTGVSSLLDKSLIHSVNDGRTPRFRMLETIREFAHDQLNACGDVETSQALLARWCRALVSRATPFDPTTQLSWYDDLESEYGNLHAALTWLDTRDHTPALFELLTQLRWFWFLSGREEEGHHWYLRLLDRIHDHRRRALVLLLAGQFAVMRAEPDPGRHLTEAASLARATSDYQVEAEAYFYLAASAEYQGDNATAEALFRKARELNDKTSNTWRRHAIDYHLGIAHYAAGELEPATTVLEQVADAAQEINDPIVSTLCRSFLALILCQHGEPERAAAIVRQFPEATRGIFHHDVKVMLGASAVVAATLGDFPAAARIFGAMSQSAAPLVLPERIQIDQARQNVRAGLGDEHFDRLWKEGQRHTPGQTETVIGQLGTTGSIESGIAPASPGASDGLTRRELDVLKLLADGLSNQQIADTLSISKRTVAHHVASILGTLGVHSRTAAASYAIRNRIA